MLDVKSMTEKKYDRSIPKISFENEGIILELLDLIKNDMSIYQYMGLLLLNLGFETEDNIFLCNYDKNDNSFDCMLNNNERYRIKFNFDNNQIDVTIHNNVYGYECEKIERSELGMRVSLGSYTYEYDDGMKFTRVLSRYKAKFIVSLCGYIMELELEKPDDVILPMYDDKGCYAKYRLENEDILTKYLCSFVVFDNSIIDIYKKLCEVYIDDVSRYPDFSLKMSTPDEDGNLKIIDLIHLKYGELEEIAVTKDERTIFLDKYNNWSFEAPAEDLLPVNFSMTSKNGKVSCVFSAMEDYDLAKQYLPDGLENDMDIANEEVIKIRRKVREVFNKNGDKNV